MLDTPSPHGEGGGPVTAAPAPCLTLEHISKRFPGVVALNDVSLSLYPGEVHAICGENGAGKSTLMKIVSGQQPPDEGRIRYLGEERHFKSVSEAEHVGIAIIHQELNLVPHLTVAENIFLAREPVRFGLIDRRKMQADTEACLARLGVAISPRAPVAKLSVAQQQMVEIAKALSLDARVLILDEPTSSLTESETQALFKVIQDLKARGVGMLYISHRLDEMRHIVDRVTILRDGRYVSTQRFAETSVDAIVAGMVGRSLDEKFPPRTAVPTGEVLLRAQGLTRKGVFQDISFELRRGEILGFAGLMGAGRTEIARAIFGADRLDAGQVEINGRAVTLRSPRDGIDQGIAYLSEDRKKDGLAVKMTLAHNLTLANLGALCTPLGFIRFKEEARVAQDYVRRLDIRTPSIDKVTRYLSGGNQQKIIIGKWLFRDARIMFFDEPTRGIDVGAKYAIYEMMDQLAAQGIGVVLISSELPELLGMSDRILVFHEGRLTGDVATRTTTQDQIMHYASGCTSH
ncbi:sugar ABC transporter ATP-binding protein [Pseudomonas sp. 102515]|uniref:sugar ABC transporter ATP-binding protein n=1 Tax=Pseudomonas sp. 102515 TaxID=3071568 RepID=UPI002801CDBA|nr:ATP-binding cassette domain-containing protein [Pseudomonas sp. 102515]MDQ7912026.1 sugar ABC transporter ATP-binding protein [Pseudomonas sp. 102515]